MSHSTRLPGLILALTIALSTAAGCSSGGSSGASGSSSSFPVAIQAANGTVTIDKRPTAIVSLSATATEMLYAIGAGGQMKAVDKYSNYPKTAPITSLDGFNPNIEAIASYKPDLVVVDQDSPDFDSRFKALGIPVLNLPTATSLSDAYHQYVELGAATGRVNAAENEVTQVKSQLSQIVSSAPASARGDTYYYELDQTYYSVTSSTFIGQILGMLGLKNIADKAPGASQNGGYPQLSAEFILAAHPGYIFLADTLCCGQSLHTVEARPGWAVLPAVQHGRVLRLNDDIASRWGPRIVDLLQAVANELRSHPVSSGG